LEWSAFQAFLFHWAIRRVVRPVKNTTVFPPQQCLEYEFKTTPKQLKSGHDVQNFKKVLSLEILRNPVSVCPYRSNFRLVFSFKGWWWGSVYWISSRLVLLLKRAERRK